MKISLRRNGCSYSNQEHIRNTNKLTTTATFLNTEHTVSSQKYAVQLRMKACTCIGFMICVYITYNNKTFLLSAQT